MAKKFFKKKVYNKKRNIINIVIISICIIGVAICFFITSSLSNDPLKNASIVVSESVNVEVHSKLPDSDKFFKELTGVDEKDIEIDFNKVDITKLGSYEVTIEIHGKDFESKVNVIDITAPELILKDVRIESGDKYEVTDFLENCSDNSKETCKLEYLTNSVDQEGKEIDYTKFTKNGTYEIKIVAKDSSNNQTIKSAKLIIGESKETISCEYGSLEYDSNNILAYIAGSNNCALDLNLYQTDSIRTPVIELADAETNKLKNDINEIDDLTAELTVNRTINPILNTTGNGLVGYTVFMEVTDSTGNIIVNYYLNIDGNRVYVNNPYNLK